MGPRSKIRMRPEKPWFGAEGRGFDSRHLHQPTKVLGRQPAPERSAVGMHHRPPDSSGGRLAFPDVRRPAGSGGRWRAQPGEEIVEEFVVVDPDGALTGFIVFIDVDLAEK